MSLHQLAPRIPMHVTTRARTRWNLRCLSFFFFFCSHAVDRRTIETQKGGILSSTQHPKRRKSLLVYDELRAIINTRLECIDIPLV